MSVIEFTVKDLCDFYATIDKTNKYFVKAKYICEFITKNYNLVLDIDDIYTFIETFKYHFNNSFSDAVWWSNLYMVFNYDISFYHMHDENKWLLDTPDHPFEQFLKSRYNII